jgi:hypothetical protein
MYHVQRVSWSFCLSGLSDFLVFHSFLSLFMYFVIVVWLQVSDPEGLPSGESITVDARLVGHGRFGATIEVLPTSCGRFGITDLCACQGLQYHNACHLGFAASLLTLGINTHVV